jgi:hypothetical protein
MEESAMRAISIAALLLALAIVPAEAVQPVKGVVKGTTAAATGVASGTVQAGRGVARGGATVARGVGHGLKCVFTLGIRC